jgi:hypothetical protein
MSRERRLIAGLGAKGQSEQPLALEEPEKQPTALVSKASRGMQLVNKEGQEIVEQEVAGESKVGDEFWSQWKSDRRTIRYALEEPGLDEVVFRLLDDVQPPHGDVSPEEETARLTAAIAGSMFSDLTGVNLWELKYGLVLPRSLDDNARDLIEKIFAYAILAEDCRIHGPFSPEEEQHLRSIRLEDLRDTARAMQLVYWTATPEEKVAISSADSKKKHVSKLLLPRQSGGEASADALIIPAGMTADQGVGLGKSLAGNILPRETINALRLEAQGIFTPDVVRAMYNLDFIPGLKADMRAKMPVGEDPDSFFDDHPELATEITQSVLTGRTVFFSQTLQAEEPDLFIVGAALEALLLRCKHFPTMAEGEADNGNQIEIIMQALTKFGESLRGHLGSPCSVMNQQAERVFMSQEPKIEYREDGSGDLTQRAKLMRCGYRCALGSVPEPVETPSGGLAARYVLRVADTVTHMQFSELAAMALRTIQRHSMAQLMCPTDGSPSIIGVKHELIPKAISRFCDILGLDLDLAEIERMAERLLQVEGCVGGGVPLLEIGNEIFRAMDQIGLCEEIRTKGYRYPALAYFAMSVLAPRLKVLECFPPAERREIVALMSADPSMATFTDFVTLTDVAMHALDAGELRLPEAEEEVAPPTSEDIYETVKNQFPGQTGTARKIINWMTANRDRSATQCGHPLFEPVMSGLDRIRAGSLFGPPGTGKTSTLRLLAAACGLLGVAELNAKELSEPGFTGKDISQLFCDAIQNFADKNGISFERAKMLVQTGQVLISVRDSQNLWRRQAGKSQAGQAEGWNPASLRAFFLPLLDPMGGYWLDLTRYVGHQLEKMGRLPSDNLLLAFDSSLSDQADELWALADKLQQTFSDNPEDGVAFDRLQDAAIMGLENDWIVRAAGGFIATMHPVTEQSVSKAYYDDAGMRACKHAFVHQTAFTYGVQLVFAPEADELLVQAMSQPHLLKLFGYRQMLNSFADLGHVLRNVYGDLTRVAGGKIVIDKATVAASLLYAENIQVFSDTLERCRPQTGDQDQPDPQAIFEELAAVWQHRHLDLVKKPSFAFR